MPPLRVPAVRTVHLRHSLFSVLGALRPQRSLTFYIGDLKLRDLAKLYIFWQIIKKSNFKKSVMTSF